MGGGREVVGMRWKVEGGMTTVTDRRVGTVYGIMGLEPIIEKR